MHLELIKCHGSNNDFLIIDEMSTPFFTEEQRSALSILLCDRVNGIGADGILYILNSEKVDAKMRVFNADGSEASMCGNGLRCVARYVCEKLKVDRAIIETMKANLEVSKQDSIFGEIPTYQVEISPISFNLRDLPLQLPQETLLNEKIPTLSDLSFTALSVPNPHIISIVGKEEIQSNLQKELSEIVNNPNPLFPDGVNVSFVNPLKKGHIFVRTFERGVGFTNACGTAMSASTLVTCLHELNDFDKEVEVFNPGGQVRCIAHKIADLYKIDLIGNATYTNKYEMEINHDYSSFQVIKNDEYTEEIGSYKEFEVFAKTFLDEWM